MSSSRRIKTIVPTRSELVVLRLVAQGLSNSEIAVKLNVSERTTASHVQNLLNKTGCRSRLALVIHFMENGTLEPIRTDSYIENLKSTIKTIEKERDDAIDRLQVVRRQFRESLYTLIQEIDF